MEFRSDISTLKKYNSAVFLEQNSRDKNKENNNLRSQKNFEKDNSVWKIIEKSLDVPMLIFPIKTKITYHSGYFFL